VYEDGYGNMIPIAVTLFCCNVLSSCHIRKTISKYLYGVRRNWLSRKNSW